MLVPTRELAAQVALEARRLLFGTGRTVALLHGGQSVKPQLEQLAFAPTVVVSTPGRLLTCAADEGYVSLAEVKTLILDEADQMLDMGFADDMSEILGACTHAGRQTCLFSATLPKDVHHVAQFATREDAVLIDTVGDEEEQTNAHVPQVFTLTSLTDQAAELEVSSPGAELEACSSRASEDEAKPCDGPGGAPSRSCA